MGRAAARAAVLSSLWPSRLLERAVGAVGRGDKPHAARALHRCRQVELELRREPDRFLRVYQPMRPPEGGLPRSLQLSHDFGTSGNI